MPGVRIRTEALRVRPNSAPELFPALADLLERHRHADRPLHLNTSSGTPQMLEVLKTLRGTGWFGEADVTLWQVDDPKYRVVGQPFHREAHTPFLAEVLRLEAAFGAMRRFDFAGARDEFAELARYPLELPDRLARVVTLEQMCGALLLVDERDFIGAASALSHLKQHVPPLTPLRDLLSEAATQTTDALVWLTWGRYDRARAQSRVADALIWAVILHEVMVVQLAQLHEVYAEKEITRRDLPPAKFETLWEEVPELRRNGRGGVLDVRHLKNKLKLLAAPSLGVANLEVFNVQTNAGLDQLRIQRNDVIHDSRVLSKVDLVEVDAVVSDLLQAFPFQAVPAQSWVQWPDDCPVSACSLQDLSGLLQDWLG